MKIIVNITIFADQIKYNKYTLSTTQYDKLYFSFQFYISFSIFLQIEMTITEK